MLEVTFWGGSTRRKKVCKGGAFAERVQKRDQRKAKSISLKGGTANAHHLRRGSTKGGGKFTGRKVTEPIKEREGSKTGSKSKIFWGEGRRWE